MEWVTANAVALMSQKRITLGFKVFIKNPEAKIFAKSVLLKRATLPSGSRVNGYPFKKNIEYAHCNQEATTNIANYFFVFQ
jgi:hypothetical protein